MTMLCERVVTYYVASPTTYHDHHHVYRTLLDGVDAIESLLEVVKGGAGGRHKRPTAMDQLSPGKKEQSYVIIRLDQCVATQVRNCTWYQSMGDPRNSHPDSLVGRGSHFY